MGEWEGQSWRVGGGVGGGKSVECERVVVCDTKNSQSSELHYHLVPMSELVKLSSAQEQS